MQEKQLELGDDVIKYKIQGDGIMITSYSGTNPVLELPDGVLQDKEEVKEKEGIKSTTENPQRLPVVCLGKKAFLGKKNLRKIVLPDTVVGIEDWAFANCDKLEEIVLGNNCRQYGKGVFQGCKALKKVLIYYGTGEIKQETFSTEQHQIGSLLAATISLLDAPHLFTPDSAGSEQWLRQWDNKLLQYLHTEDKRGFTVVVLCGEEDYGSQENSLSYFIQKKRQAKVALCFMRLLNPIGIREDTKRELGNYLKNHTKGCSSEETWQVVLQEHGNERQYYQVMMDYDCIDHDNIQGLLEELGDSYPEMKSFLLQYQQEKLGVKDFFQSFEL